MSIVTDGGRAARPRALVVRAVAGSAGLWLAFAGLSSYLLSRELLGLIADGRGKALDGLDVADSAMTAVPISPEQVDVARSLLSGGWNWVDGLIGGMVWATRGFGWLALVALAAGALSFATALARRPDKAWPEWVWGLSAPFALMPAASMHAWLLASVPAAMMLYAATFSHFLRRKHIFARAGRAGRRAVGSAGRAGGDVVDRVRELRASEPKQLPPPPAQPDWTQPSYEHSAAPPSADSGLVPLDWPPPDEDQPR